jgi:DNA-binding transcriptional MerR regulator
MEFIRKLYSTTDAAKLLKVPEHKIHYGHRTGDLDDATYRLAGKRGYSASDMKRLAEYFNVDVPDKVLEDEKEDLDRNFVNYMAKKYGVTTEEGKAKLAVWLRQQRPEEE